MLIQVRSQSGGTGCTTITASTASALSHKHSVLVVDCGRDLHTMLSIDAPAGQLTPHTNTLTVMAAAGITANSLDDAIGYHRNDFEHIVIDNPPTGAIDDGLVIGVVTNCYLNLRTWTANSSHVDLFIYRHTPGRALTCCDVETVIGQPIAVTITDDAAISRSVDSGLITTRPPASLTNPIRQLLTQLQTQSPTTS